MSDIGSGDEGISSQSTYYFKALKVQETVPVRSVFERSFGRVPRPHKSKYLIVPVSKWRIRVGYKSGIEAS